MPPESVGRTAALIRHNTVLLLRDPGPLASRMIMPLAFAAILRPLYVAAQGKEQGTTQAVLATLVTFSFLALSIVGSSVLTERIQHTWERLQASAAHPCELLVGKAVPVMAAMLAQQLAILGFAVLAFGMPLAHPLLLAYALSSWTVSLLAIGAMLGVLTRSMGALSAAYDIGGMLLSSLGGALVPLAAMPHWVRDLAPISPGYWAVTALRRALHGDAPGALTASLALLGFAAAAGAVAALRIGRGEDRSAHL